MRGAVHLHGTLTRRQERALEVIRETFDYLRTVVQPAAYAQLEHAERRCRNRILYAMRKGEKA